MGKMGRRVKMMLAEPVRWFGLGVESAEIKGVRMWLQVFS